MTIQGPQIEKWTAKDNFSLSILLPAYRLFHLKYSHASLFRAIYTKAGGNSFFQF